MVPWATGVFGRNFVFVHIQDNATPHTAHLLFWDNRIWRSWTLRGQTWNPLSLFGSKWCLDPRHEWPPFHYAGIAACCPPSMGYSLPKTGEDLWWRACHVMYVLFSPTEREHKLLVVWLFIVNMLNRFIWNVIKCFLVFFHDTIIWIHCFSTVELP